MFENDVKEYGFQTPHMLIEVLARFENDVKEYGFQTKAQIGTIENSLRMM